MIRYCSTNSATSGLITMDSQNTLHYLDNSQAIGRNNTVRTKYTHKELGEVI